MTRERFTFTQIIYMVLFTGPFFFILAKSFSNNSPQETETWGFILEHTLPALFSNTLYLIILCVLITLILGFFQAVLTTLTNFPGRRALHGLFILPLAYPLYVISYIYVGMFEYGGDLASFLRRELSFNIVEIVDIKSVYSIAFIFSLVLTPYSYLFLRSFLKRLNPKQIWSARILGQGQWGVLWRVIVPQARPWIIAVAILVTLEVLCDFGGVSIFNYETFTVAIYEAWMGLFSLNSAIKLSFFPLLLALLFFMVNQYLGVTSQKKESSHQAILFNPGNLTKGIIFIGVIIYSIFILLLPLGVLTYWIAQVISIETFVDLLPYLKDTIIIGFLGSLSITFLALFYLFKDRLFCRKNYITNFLKLGYALPGTIVAIALMSSLAVFKINYFGPIALVILIVGLCIRFFAPVIDLQQKSYDMIHRKNDWAAASLGANRLRIFFKVHLPILRPALFSAGLIAFLEIIKEMPITLILRPHNINTLSTKIYELTSEGEWERTAVFAMTLFLFGAISLYFFSNEDKRL